MKKEELIQKLQDIEWEDFDYYKITFPTTTTLTTTNTTTKTTTYPTTKGDEKEREICELITNNPLLNAEEIARQVKLTKDGVRYHLKNLKKKGIIKRKGHGRGGSWEVVIR